MNSYNTFIISCYLNCFSLPPIFLNACIENVWILKKISVTSNRWTNTYEGYNIRFIETQNTKYLQEAILILFHKIEIEKNNTKMLRVVMFVTT